MDKTRIRKLLRLRPGYVGEIMTNAKVGQSTVFNILAERKMLRPYSTENIEAVWLEAQRIATEEERALA